MSKISFSTACSFSRARIKAFLLKDSNYKMFQSPHNPGKGGQSLQNTIWSVGERPCIPTAVGRRGCPRVPTTLSLWPSVSGPVLCKAFPPGKPPWRLQQPKPSQPGRNARPCSAYHFTEHKLLINCRAFQGQRHHSTGWAISLEKQGERLRPMN